MTTRIIIILIAITHSITAAHAQRYEPLTLAKMIFSKDVLPDISDYVTGEYKGRPNGQDLQTGLTTKFTLLGQTDKTAVVAITILDTLEKEHDIYLHFRKDNTWKVSAVRALALTAVIEQIRNEIEKLTPKQVDSIIRSSKKKKNSEQYSMFGSKEEYEFELGNAKLTLESDGNIVQHFITNESEFERLRNLALSQLNKEKAANKRGKKLIEDLKNDYQKIFISSVSTGDPEFGNCINFLIGGMIDNLVGYIYVADKKDLPEMSPNNLIMIREIGNGWYIYKTT